MFGNVWRGITGRLHGELVSVIATGIGPSLIGDAVYALDRPGAACLYSGTCGGLYEALDIGDNFVAAQAVCGDGYSLHFGYTPFSLVSGDAGALQAVKVALAASGERFDAGMTFTTSSVVRETDVDFWRTVDERCRIIEMGAAAFYAAALASGKRASRLFLGDRPADPGQELFRPASAHRRSRQRGSIPPRRFAGHGPAFAFVRAAKMPPWMSSPSTTI